jgi:hypothetical protein
MPDGTQQTRLNVNFSQVANPGEATTQGGNNLNLNMSEEDARAYDVGDYYILTLQHDDTYPPINEAGAQEVAPPVVGAPVPTAQGDLT